MLKVYRLNGLSLILLLLLILGVFIVGLMLLGPIVLAGLFLIFLYIGYMKFRRSINEFIKNIKKKKIKIKNESDNGEVKINFAKTIEINDENSNNENKNKKESGTITLDKQNDPAQKYIEKDQDLSQFINYLKEHGFELKDGILYHGDKIAYPIYKKSYPVNEIIKLYDERPVCDIVVIGLKGEPSNPKFIYILPIDKTENRMGIEELKKYETKLK